MNDKENRIAKLSQRFKTHATGRPKNTSRSRERQSFYLDIALTEQIDKVYKEISHQLYPKSVSKSMFLETLLEYGLDNINSVKSRISDLGSRSIGRRLELLAAFKGLEKGDSGRVSMVLPMIVNP